MSWEAILCSVEEMSVEWRREWVWSDRHHEGQDRNKIHSSIETGTSQPLPQGVQHYPQYVLISTLQV